MGQSRQELHQTTIMKFAALALALLLAVGSHAASLQADAPSDLQHARALLDMFLTQMRDSANKALDQLDNTEYSEYKATVSQRLDNMHNQIKAFPASESPLTDSFYSTVSEATSEFRTSIMNDIQSLNLQTEAERQKLRDVINKHIEEYRATVETPFNEFVEKAKQEAEAMKTKLQPVVEDLQQKVSTNVEETKNALMPIVESVRVKLGERVEALKGAAAPYIEEYKDQLQASYAQAQSINTDDLTALREKIEPLAVEVKDKLKAIFEAIAATVTKN